MDLFNNRQRYYFIMRIECIFIVLFFFNTLSPNTDHCSHQHRAICKSPLPQNTTTLIPISAISVHRSLFTDLCSLLTVHCSLTSVHSSFFILHSSFFILHSSFFILHSSFFTLHSSFFTLHSSLFILHSSLFILKNYPTLPSKLISKSFWASTANSIGSLLSTSFPKPFTMREIAFSVSIPR